MPEETLPADGESPSADVSTTETMTEVQAPTPYDNFAVVPTDISMVIITFLLLAAVVLGRRIL